MGARTIPDMRLSNENIKSLAFLHFTQKNKNLRFLKKYFIVQNWAIEAFP